MDEDARALDVPQELHPQPLPVMRPLDQPGDVGHHEGPELAEVHHTQVRLERGERIRRNLRPGRRDSRNERRFPSVREADDADVGDELQLEDQAALLAVRPGLGFARCLVGGRREGRVAAPPAPARRHPDDVAGARKVRQEHAAFVPHHRSGRHLDVEVLAAAPGPVAPLAVAAALRLKPSLVAEGVQSLEGRIRHHEDGAAVSPGTAVRAAPGDVLLAAEADTAVAPATSGDHDSRLIDQHVTALLASPGGALTMPGIEVRRRGGRVSTAGRGRPPRGGR